MVNLGLKVMLVAAYKEERKKELLLIIWFIAV